MTTEAPRSPAANGTPPAASTREYLRAGLPAVYRDRTRSARARPEVAYRADPFGLDDPFVMRFVAGLEEVLDPIVAMLDLLPAHLDVALAPPDFIAMLGEWLGLELDAALEADSAPLLAAHRRLVDEAIEITRRRGTRSGIEHLLGLAFGDVRLDVHDSGGVTWSSEPGPPAPAPDPSVTVTCPAALRDAPWRLAAIRRVVEDVRPAGVRLELRVADEEEPS
jgi:phage tail-like protein